MSERGPKDLRILPCWIDKFVESHRYLGAPPIWLKWAAYSSVAAALERKVFVVLRGRKLYLNLYIFLVGPPGTGKSTALEAARNIVVQIPSIKLSPTKVTAEKFINLLSKANSVEIVNGEVSQHVSFSAFCSEIAVFIPPGDRGFTATLTDLYDCPNYWSYETISRGKDAIENLFVNFSGGVTPTTLATIVSDATIGSGFSARVLFIYAEEGIKTDPFDVLKTVEHKDFVHDLELVNMLKGPFSHSLGAMKIFRDWYTDGMSPAPADSRFAEYNPRRFTHWMKLAAIRCASRSNEMIVSEEDVLSAKADMLEAESFMPTAFASIGANPINQALEHTRHWMMIEHATKNTAIPESDLRKRLMTQVPLQYVDQSIELLLSSGYAMHLGGTKPNRFIVPKS